MTKQGENKNMWSICINTSHWDYHRRTGFQCTNQGNTFLDNEPVYAQKNSGTLKMIGLSACHYTCIIQANRHTSAWRFFHFFCVCVFFSFSLLLLFSKTAGFIKQRASSLVYEEQLIYFFDFQASSWWKQTICHPVWHFAQQSPWKVVYSKCKEFALFSLGQKILFIQSRP